LAAVYGPAQPKFSRLEQPEKATIEVNYKSSKGQQTGAADTEKEQFLAKTLASVVITSQYPRTVVVIVIQVLQEDGGVLACAVNAAGMALMNAGVALNAVPLGICCQLNPVKTKSGDENQQGGASSVVRLDPIQKEEEKAEASMTFVLSSVEEGILASTSVGLFSPEDYFMCAEIATRGSKAILSFIRASLEQKTLTELQSL